MESRYLDFNLAVPLVDCACKYVCACMCWADTWCWWPVPLLGTLSLCVKWKGWTTIVLCLPSPEFWETYILFHRISGALVFLPAGLNTTFHRHYGIKTVSLRTITRGNRYLQWKFVLCWNLSIARPSSGKSLIYSVNKYWLHSFIFHQFCFLGIYNLLKLKSDHYNNNKDIKEI